jgi:hypothetical protein
MPGWESLSALHEGLFATENKSTGVPSDCPEQQGGSSWRAGKANGRADGARLRFIRLAGLPSRVDEARAYVQAGISLSSAHRWSESSHDVEIASEEIGEQMGVEGVINR